jgi:hypothetical protein
MMFFRIAEPTALRGLLLCFVVLLAVATRSFGQALPSDKPKSETVRGTVINAVTQAPIPRALVATSDNRAGVLTDGEGHFEITLPSTENGSAGGVTIFGNGQPQQPRSYTRRGNTYWFTARKPGFLDDPEAKPIVAPSSGDDLTIALIPEAIIKGRIALASGDAALGVTIQLFSRQVREGLPRWTQSSTVRANSAGEFRFAELQPGSYKLVTHEYMANDPITNIPGSKQYGFPPVYYPGVPDFSAASTIELTAGQEFQADFSLARQPYYQVKIPVAGGEIKGGLNISVEGQRGPGYSLGYDAGEQTIVGLLPNGTYVVEASTFGQNSVSGSGSIRVTGAAVDGPALTLVPKSSVRLDVREEFTDTSWNTSASWSDGKHTFSLHGSRTYLQATVESADDFAQARFGSIRPPSGSNDESLVIEDLSPGRYWLRLHTSRGYIASATQGSTDLLRQPLTIGSGTAAPIEVRVRDDVAELDATVATLALQSATAPGDGSAEAAVVWMYLVPLPGGSGEFKETTVSTGSEFIFLGMAPGDYHVLAFSTAQPHLPYRDAEAMKAYESKGPVVHLTAGQKTTVQVETISSE